MAMVTSSRAARIAWLLALCAAALAGAAHAGDNGAVIIDTDRTVIMAGGSVSPSKPVPEHFIAAGGRVVVDQPVGKSVAAAGGSVEIRAPIGHSAGIAAGSITVDASIGNNLSASGGEVRVARNAVIGNAARLFGGTITIDGRIRGSLHASAERVIINGQVDGDVRAAGETIVLGPGAKVGGSMTYASANEIQRGEGASIAGNVTRREPRAGKHLGDEEDELPQLTKAATVFGSVVSFLALLGFGAIFLSVAPIFSVEAPDRIQSSPGKSLGYGLLAVVGVPLVAVLFILTIVGIPVGAMLLMLYPLALLFGFMVATLFVSNAASKLLKRQPPPTVALAVVHYGIALLAVMLLARLPSIGGLLLFVLIVLGVGAFSIELWRRMKKPALPPRAAALA